jgi:hypothetical protein
MRACNLAAITLIALASSLLTACQKKSVEQTLHAAQMNRSPLSVKGSANQKDLGVLPLSNHISTTVTLGTHQQCTITPTLMKSGNLQIIVEMETTAADGTPRGMDVARVLAKPGEPFDISLGGMELAFTPQLSDP